VVDDDAAFVKLLCDVLNTTEHLEPVGTALSGEQAVELVEELQPDVVLIDVRMRGMDGVEAAEMIKARDRGTLVVLVSALHPDEMPAATLASADAVIWKHDLEGRRLDELWLLHRDRS
jgi:chemotaxis response regulator CheB